MVMDQEAAATVSLPGHSAVMTKTIKNVPAAQVCCEESFQVFAEKFRNSQSSGFTHLVGITTVTGTLNRGPALGIAVSYPHT